MKTCYQRLAAIVAATVLIGFSAQMIGYAESDVVTIPRSKILTSEDSGVMESDISGRFYFTIEGDRAVTVSVTKYTAENGKNGDVYHKTLKIRFKINLFFNGTPLLMIVKMMTNFLLVTNI